jgi:hypothetical protein
MYGCTGANHPRYGKEAANAMTINVYSVVDNQLVHSFTSQAFPPHFFFSDPPFFRAPTFFRAPWGWLFFEFVTINL